MIFESEHTHAPDAAAIASKRLIGKMKRQAKRSDDTANTIVQNTIRAEHPLVVAAMPKKNVW